MKKYLLSIISIFFLITACNLFSNKDVIILKRAESLMEEHPDSALYLLEVEIYPDKLDEAAFNHYTLLYIQAKDKNDKEIKNDTLIYNITDYYLKKKDYNNAAKAAFYTGKILSDLDKKEEAMFAFMNAETYAKEIENDALKGLIQYNIGELYYFQYLRDEAIPRYKKALYYFNKAEKYRNEIITYNKLGYTFFINRNIDSSFTYFDKSIELAEKHRDLSQQAHIYQNIGIAYQNIEDRVKAREYFQRARPLFKKDSDKARIYYNIASTFLGSGKEDSIMFYLDKSIKIIQNDKGNPLEYVIHDLLTNIKEKEGNHKEALKYNKEKTKALTNILGKTNNQAILDVQKKYDFQLIQNQNKQLEIDKRDAYIFALVIFILAIFLGIFAYRNHRRNKEAKAEVEEKKAHIEDLAATYNSEKDSVRNVLLEHLDIFRRVAIFEKQFKDYQRTSGQKILLKFNDIVYSQGAIKWDLIFRSISKIQKNFPEKLVEMYPTLDENEVKICCLILGGFNNSEMSTIMNFSLNTIQMKKSIIRKKMGIGGYGNMTEFLSENIK